MELMKNSGEIDLEGGGRSSEDHAEDESKTFIEIVAKPSNPFSQYLSFGDVANLITFFIMIFGILLQIFLGKSFIIRLILAFGLFGFAGGITNWLAVKMLFDQIPFLWGSGVIPRRFKEIREAIKIQVLEMFFDKKFLSHYLGPRSRELLHSIDLPGILKKMANSPDFDEMFITKLTELSLRPEGMMLLTISQMFGGIPMMAPMLKPLLISFGEEMTKSLVEKFDPMAVISVDKIRSELDILMTDKLQELSPNKIKVIMEDVIRNHLGWLVVWGNIFGGLIGIVSVLAGYG